MPPKMLLLSLSAVAFSVLGQLLLKSGAHHLAGVGRVAFLLTAARNLYVVAGLVAWIASTICWLYVLRETPLSKAYALNSLTYVLTPLVGVYLFGESVGRLHTVGIVLIILGVAFVLSGK